jgi:hypothetical protein
MMLRGACHIHSRYSYDGTLSLQEIRDVLRAQGASFALMAEHTDALDPAAAQAFIAECQAVSDDQFRFIPGFEVPYLGTHILVLGAHHYYVGDSREILARWQSEGALLVVAHPHRNGYRLDQFLRDHSDGIEIWNSQYDGIHAPRGHAVHLYRGLQRSRSSVKAYGSLDLHRGTHRYGPQIAIEVSDMSETTIISALRTGSFSMVRGPMVINADSNVLQGGAFTVGLLGILMPAAVGFLRLCSSLASRFGLRSFALKKWIRTRI